MEAIHRLGAVQEAAIFFAAAKETLEISYWSENATRLDFSGQSEQSLAGITLGQQLPSLADDIAELVEDPNNRHAHIPLIGTVEKGGVVYDAILCVADPHVFLELLPATDLEPRALKAHLRASQRAVAATMQAKTFRDAEQIVADAVRALTNYGRVKIYQFQPDESGEVTAESKDDAMPSFVGLRFPATDIPKQARHLYAKLPFRIVSSTDDATSTIVSQDGPARDALDLTWCVSRSVSTMHAAYLRNMGIQAAFSCSLMDGDKLWGLIACHHNEPLNLSFDIIASQAQGLKRMAEELKLSQPAAQTPHTDHSGKLRPICPRCRGG